MYRPLTSLNRVHYTVTNTCIVGLLFAIRPKVMQVGFCFGWRGLTFYSGLQEQAESFLNYSQNVFKCVQVKQFMSCQCMLFWHWLMTNYFCESFQQRLRFCSLSEIIIALLIPSNFIESFPQGVQVCLSVLSLQLQFTLLNTNDVETIFGKFGKRLLKRCFSLCFDDGKLI
jgi:hypothetical protein